VIAQILVYCFTHHMAHTPAIDKSFLRLGDFLELLILILINIKGLSLSDRPSDFRHEGNYRGCPMGYGWGCRTPSPWGYG
jgi:hypothetical protein